MNWYNFIEENIFYKSDANKWQYVRVNRQWYYRYLGDVVQIPKEWRIHLTEPTFTSSEKRLFEPLPDHILAELVLYRLTQ